MDHNLGDMVDQPSLLCIEDDRGDDGYSADLAGITIDEPVDGRMSWCETPTHYGWCLGKGNEPWIILRDLHRQYDEGKIENLDQLKKRLPQETTSLIYGVEEQFQRVESRECWLLLGNCPQYQHNMTNTLYVPASANLAQKEVLTLLIVRAISEELGDTIGLDVRKDCWKNNTNEKKEGTRNEISEINRSSTGRPSYSGCRYIDEKELKYWLWAMKLELLVAQRDFGITWKGCFAWSKAPCRIARSLALEGQQLYQKPLALYEDHLADLGRSEIVFFQKWRRAALILKDIALCLTELGGNRTRETKEGLQLRLYNKIAQAIRDGRPYMELPGFDLRPLPSNLDICLDLSLKSTFGKLNGQDGHRFQQAITARLLEEEGQRKQMYNPRNPRKVTTREKRGELIFSKRIEELFETLNNANPALPQNSSDDTSTSLRSSPSYTAEFQMLHDPIAAQRASGSSTADLVKDYVEANNIDGLRIVLEMLKQARGSLADLRFYGVQLTALHLAALNGQAEMAELLLQHGADVEATTLSGKRPLHFAASRSNLLDDYCKTVKLLVFYGAQVDARNHPGLTALDTAIETGVSEKTVQTLLALGADVSSMSVDPDMMDVYDRAKILSVDDKSDDLFRRRLAIWHAIEAWTDKPRATRLQLLNAWEMDDDIVVFYREKVAPELF